MKRHHSSFRDRTGYLFEEGGTLYRRVEPSYAPQYEKLMSSGLYEELTGEGLLIPHQEVSKQGGYRTLRPERLPFISYPYEWCFSALKDAALATLEIQRRALARGMTLKDASAYNIQFRQGRPTLIDTLSFEIYREGEPWVAYRQFCQHFLAPLALMAHTDVRLSQLLRVHIDGIPLDLAARLLPARARLRPGLLLHLQLHARGQERYADKAPREAQLPKRRLLALVENLDTTVRRLRWRPAGTEWGEYYTFTNYEDAAFREKARLVTGFLERAKPGSVWDLGGNVGVFSRLASERGIPTVSFDIDPAAVEKNYREMAEKGEATILPLVLDLTNPSPALGWAHRERASLAERGPADLVLFLAMIHHMAIGNNVPLGSVAESLRELGRRLVIEFVPKEDSQVRKMLRSREDIFDDYDQKGFERAFGEHYKTVERQAITGTKRTLYLMEAK